MNETNRGFIASLAAFAYISSKFSARMKIDHRYLYLIWASISLTSPALGQEAKRDSTAAAPVRTSISDTLRHSGIDTTIRQSIRRITLAGSISPITPPADMLDSARINFTDYRTTTDFFTLFPGVYTSELGDPGQYQDITIDGLSLRSIAFMRDGIRLNDPFTGTYNLSWYPTESVDRAEMIAGPAAYLLGLNSTGGAMNAVSRNRKAIHPFSHIRYSEAAYGFAVIDGMVSQDVLRGLNVTTGVQHFTYGPRFTNSSCDAWSGRLNLNYALSPQLGLFASELYTQTQLNLNGGIDIDTTPDSLRIERLQANVLQPDAYEKITRHEVQMGAAIQPTADTADLGVLTLFLTSNLRELRAGEHYSIPPIPYLHQDQREQWIGARYVQHFRYGDQSLEAGGEYQAQWILITPSTDETRASYGALFGSLRMSAGGLVTVVPGVRLERYRSQNGFSWGTDVILKPTPCTELSGGVSSTRRFPTFQELWGQAPSVGSRLADAAPEKHKLLEAGFRWNYTPRFSMQVKAYQREINDGIGIVQADEGDTIHQYYFERTGLITLKGIDGSASLRLGSWLIEGTARYLHRSDDNGNPLQPRWTGRGGFYFHDTLVHGHLGLKAGVRGSYFSGFSGNTFDGMTYLYLPGSHPVEIPATATLDLVIIAHIGDAYIHFIWDNLLDKNYIMTDYYPMTGRQLRFGVSWSFED